MTDQTFSQRPAAARRRPRLVKPQTRRPNSWPFRLAVLAFVGLVAVAVVSHEPGPDPHYVKATGILERFEGPVAVDQRDYLDPTYQRVLEELAKVDPDSPSAAAARELSDDLRGRIRDYEEQKRRRAEAVRRERERRAEEERRLAEARRAAARVLEELKAGEQEGGEDGSR